MGDSNSGEGLQISKREWRTHLSSERGVNKKLSGSQKIWAGLLEQFKTPFDDNTVKLINLLASNNFKEAEEHTKIAGEEIYLSVIQPKLKFSTKSKVNLKSLSKKEAIKRENTIRLIEKDMKFPAHSKWAEMLVFSLLKEIEILISKDSKTTSKEKDSYDILYGIDKLVERCGNMKDFSSACLSDLKAYKEILRKHFPFNLVRLANFYSDIISFGSLKTDLFKKNVKANDLQRKIYSILRDNENFLVYLNAAIGSGKTIGGALIGASYVHNNDSSVFIYVCNQKEVRIGVCRLLKQASIPFGYAFRKNELSTDDNEAIDFRGVNLKVHGDCLKLKVVVADVETSAELIKNSDPFKTIVFIDEVDTDFFDIRIINKLKDLLTARTFLVSATLPRKQYLEPITSFIKGKFPKSEIIEVFDENILLGCVAFNHNGEVYLPHNYFKSAADMVSFSDHIDSFVGRFYTLPVVSKMLEGTGYVVPENVKQFELIEFLKDLFKKVAMADFEKFRNKRIHLRDLKPEFFSGVSFTFCKNSERTYGNLGVGLSRFFSGGCLVVKKSDHIKTCQDIVSCNKEYRINSAAHIARYNPEVKDFIKENRPSVLSEIPMVDRQEMIDLFSIGAAPYVEGLDLSHKYQDTVWKELSYGRVPYLVTDFNLSHGINVTLNALIILDNSQIRDLIQLTGRAGRQNVSGIPNVLLCDEAIETINNYVSNGCLDLASIEMLSKVSFL